MGERALKMDFTYTNSADIYCALAGTVLVLHVQGKGPSLKISWSSAEHRYVN